MCVARRIGGDAMTPEDPLTPKVELEGRLCRVGIRTLGVHVGATVVVEIIMRPTMVRVFL